MNKIDVEAARKKGRVLTLVVKQRWFDMYVENFKKEDYRAITPYWEIRLLKHYIGDYENPKFKDFDFVDIRNGYTNKSVVFKFEGIRIGLPNKFWSPPDFHDVLMFAIKMGDMVYTENVYPIIDKQHAERTLDENYF